MIFMVELKWTGLFLLLLLQPGEGGYDVAPL